MRNPFDNSGKKKKSNFFLNLDSWIDTALFRMFSDGSERWENITIFFRRFKVTGFKKFLVEIFDDIMASC